MHRKDLLLLSTLLCHKESAKAKGVGCLELVLYEIRVLGSNLNIEWKRLEDKRGSGKYNFE